MKITNKSSLLLSQRIKVIKNITNKNITKITKKRMKDTRITNKNPLSLS